MAEGDFELVITHGAGSITMTQDSNNKILVRPWEWNENQARTLDLELDNDHQTATQNLLSSSCAMWSGGVTGALDIGDLVDFYLYPTSAPTTKTAVFHGTIASIELKDDFTIELKAIDRLAAAEGRRVIKTFFSHYTDSAVLSTTFTGTAFYINGITAAPPYTFLGLALNDQRLNLGDRAMGTYPELVNGHEIAQPFYAQGDAVLGVNLWLTWDVNAQGEAVTVSLCSDVDGLPGPVLGSKTTTLGSASTSNLDFNLAIGGTDPILVVNGRRYWILISTAAVSPGTVRPSKVAGHVEVLSLPLRKTSRGFVLQATSIRALPGPRLMRSTWSGALRVTTPTWSGSI